MQFGGDLKMNIFKIILVIGVFVLCGCAGKSIYCKEGHDFEFGKDIVVNKTETTEIIRNYGFPNIDDYFGNYRIMKYYYKETSSKKENGARNIAGHVVPIFMVYDLGKYIINSTKDTDINDDDIEIFKNLTIYSDIETGLVKDVFYEDNEGNGKDKSDSFFIEAKKLLSENKKNEAVSLLKKSCEINPKNYRSLTLLAVICLQYEANFNEGLEYASKSKEIFKDSPDNLEVLGMLYYKTGEYAKAKESLEQALGAYKAFCPERGENQKRINAYLKILNEKISAG